MTELEYLQQKKALAQYHIEHHLRKRKDSLNINDFELYETKTIENGEIEVFIHKLSRVKAEIYSYSNNVHPELKMPFIFIGGVYR